MRKFLWLFLIVIGLVFFGQNVKAADWQISELADMGGIALPSEASNLISLKADANDKIHICYYAATNEDLKYITNVSGQWIVEMIDSVDDSGLLNSLAIDSNNKVHVAYTYSAGALDRLKYANNVSGMWQNVTLDSSINAGFFPSLAVDLNNKIHIAYQDMDNDYLKYATNSSGNWRYETLDTTHDSGLYNSLAIDSNNKIHIAYLDGTNNYLKYVTNALGAWAIMIVDNSVVSGYFNSLALDSDNKAHIGYLYYTVPNYTVRYATNATLDGNWSISDLDISSSVLILTGFTDTLVLDSDNKVRISFYEYDAITGLNQIKYMSNISGTFEKSTLNDTDNVGYPSLGVDSKNRSHLAYYDATTQKLKYAFTPGPSDEVTKINDGRDYSAYRKIHIVSSLIGSPTEMIISQYSSRFLEPSPFAGVSWEPYVASKTFKLSKTKGKKTVYMKFRDVWHAESDVVSQEVKYVGNPKFVTRKAKKKNEVKVKTKNTKYYGKDYYLVFKKYPAKFKNIKRYFLAERQNKYPKTFANAKNNLLKKYWKVTTDFNKYKSSKKTRLKLVFEYSTSEFNVLKKKVKGLKEKDLYLKFYDPKVSEWQDLQVAPDTKNHRFTVYFNSPFKYSTFYYAIGR